MSQRNRLKLSMLGVGHIGPSSVVPDLVKVIADPLADAVNQRLNSATALALIGSSEAQDALINVFKKESDVNFLIPFLQPLTLSLDYDHISQYQKLVKKADGRAAEALKRPKVAVNVQVVQQCQKDRGCYLEKLGSDNADEVVKAAVMLARQSGDTSAIVAALLKAWGKTSLEGAEFANPQEKAAKYRDQTQGRRFMLMALTRLADAGSADALESLADGLSAKEAPWPTELRTAAAYLRARGTR